MASAMACTFSGVPSMVFRQHALPVRYFGLCRLNSLSRIFIPSVSKPGNNLVEYP